MSEGVEISGGRLFMKEIGKLVIAHMMRRRLEVQKGLIEKRLDPKGCTVCHYFTSEAKLMYCTKHHIICQECQYKGQCPKCVTPCPMEGCTNKVTGIYNNSGSYRCFDCKRVLCEDHLEFCRYCGAKICEGACAAKHECDASRKRAKKCKGFLEEKHF